MEGKGVGGGGGGRKRDKERERPREGGSERNKETERDPSPSPPTMTMVCRLQACNTVQNISFMAYRLTTCQLCKPVEDFQLSIIINEEKSLDGGQGDRQCGRERRGNKLLNKKFWGVGGGEGTK